MSPARQTIAERLARLETHIEDLKDDFQEWKESVNGRIGDLEKGSSDIVRAINNGALTSHRLNEQEERLHDFELGTSKEREFCRRQFQGLESFQDNLKGRLTVWVAILALASSSIALAGSKLVETPF